MQCSTTDSQELNFYCQINTLGHTNVFLYPIKNPFHRWTNLVVEKHIYDRVDHRAALGQDWWHHAGYGSDQSPPAKGGQQSHHPVRHPAQQIAGDHGDNHEKDVVLPPLCSQQVDFSYLSREKINTFYMLHLS